MNKQAPFTGKLRHDALLFGLGVFLIGFVVPLVTGLLRGLDTRGLFTAVICTLTNTAILWIGCRYIVIKLWVYLPWQRNPWLHILAETVLIVAYAFATSVLMWTLGRQFIRPEDMEWYGFMPNFLASAGISLLISFIHEGIYFFYQWKNSLLRSELLEKEQLVSRFETLKNQVNPHFLFNSLNTLIALIEEDRDSAVDYVQKVSDFYRRLIQLSEKQLILLSEELDLIRLYFFIQQQRYGDNLRLETRVDDAAAEKSVAPLALQMLVENAVKHNIIATGQPLTITIETTPQGYVVVKNNLQKRLSEQPGMGIGLQNIRNRYALLTERPAEVIETPASFMVALPLLTV